MPILGATKIVCDYVEPLRGVGQGQGESLRKRLVIIAYIQMCFDLRRARD